MATKKAPHKEPKPKEEPLKDIVVDREKFEEVMKKLLQAKPKPMPKRVKKEQRA